MSKEIKLPKGSVAIVDDEDYAELSKNKWYVGSCGYATRNIKVGMRQKRIQMHHTIMPPAEGFYVDHINGDRLDNRRCNLRLVNPRQSRMNSGLRRTSRSGYKGVTLIRKNGSWQAQIKAPDKNIYLGVYKTAEDAARAYDKAALEHFGEYARLNFPAPTTSTAGQPAKE